MGWTKQIAVLPVICVGADCGVPRMASLEHNAHPVLPTTPNTRNVYGKSSVYTDDLIPI